jgi:hypothetical protein
LHQNANTSQPSTKPIKKKQNKKHIKTTATPSQANALEFECDRMTERSVGKCTDKAHCRALEYHDPILQIDTEPAVTMIHFCSFPPHSFFISGSAQKWAMKHLNLQ